MAKQMKAKSEVVNVPDLDQWYARIIWPLPLGNDAGEHHETTSMLYVFRAEAELFAKNFCTQMGFDLEDADNA